MDIKTFFALNEGTLHEMAGMPQDNAFNGYMYQQAMKKYGTSFAKNPGSLWPRGTPTAQKHEDVRQWAHEATAKGASYSGKLEPAALVANLEWPLKVGSGLTSKNAAANMRSLLVSVGFMTEADLAALGKAEAQKAAGGQTPKMSQVMQTAPVAAAKAPTVKKGAAPTTAPVAAPAKDTLDIPIRTKQKPVEDDPDFQ